MNALPVAVSPSGAIILGDKVVCDGFVYGFPYRVQTHIHVDHMSGFDSSKGYQDILVTPGTRELLIAEYDADLSYRSNIIAIPFGTSLIDDLTITAYSSGHMLGAIQTAVDLPDGQRAGYSGDFQGHLREIINVDCLVVDSTYGGPECRRYYSQEEAGQRFVELVLRSIKRGSVQIKSHRGTLQRALELLDGITQYPVVASPRTCREAVVYEHFGYSIPRLFDSRSEDGRAILGSGRYIWVFRKGEVLSNDLSTTTIILSAFMVSQHDPVLELSDRAYKIALSDHADFEETIEYVKATSARIVVTDNSRGGHAVELAMAIRERLGIEAFPSSSGTSRDWGT